MEESYSGYNNYETWCVALWINNDKGLYDAVNELLTAEQLEEFICELRLESSTLSHGMFEDLLRRAIARVDWDEVFRACCTTE